MADTFALAQIEKAKARLAGGHPTKAIGPARDAVFNLRSFDEAEKTLALLTELRAALEGTGRTAYIESLMTTARARRTELEPLLHFETLRTRLARLADMLLADTGSGANFDLGQLVPLVAQRDGSGELEVSERVTRYARSWESALFNAFRRGESASAVIGFGYLRDHKARLTRDLKSLAVELLSRGAKVKGLSTDAVPLVAYALLQRRLPLGDAFNPDTTIEQSNNALLTYADWMSSADPDSRVVFMKLFQLAFALGIASRYASELDLLALRLG